MPSAAAKAEAPAYQAVTSLVTGHWPVVPLMVVWSVSAAVVALLLSLAFYLKLRAVRKAQQVLLGSRWMAEPRLRCLLPLAQ